MALHTLWEAYVFGLRAAGGGRRDLESEPGRVLVEPAETEDMSMVVEDIEDTAVPENTGELAEHRAFSSAFLAMQQIGSARSASSRAAERWSSGYQQAHFDSICRLPESP